MLVFVLAVSCALVFSFLCSVSEAVLLSVGHARIEQLSRKGSRAGELLRAFKREPDVPIAAILILNTVAHTAGAAVAGASYQEAFGEAAVEWLFVALFTIAVLVFTEIVPKTLGVTYNSSLAVPVSLGVAFLVKVLRPVLVVTRLLSGLMRRGKPPPITSLDEIRLLASAGRSQGVLGRGTADIIEGAALLRELKASDAMVPRNRVAYLSGRRTLAENLDVVRRTGHSRFPYTPDGDLDKAEGIVLAKELLFHLREHDEPDWKSLLIGLLVVPENAPLNTVMRMFQRERKHLAIVVDEYGGSAGVVTLEDVLEEVVGEIQDETDREVSETVLNTDGTWSCRGSVELRALFGRLGIPNLETESTTLGGFLSERLGGVPQAGEELDVAGHLFRVLKATNKRVERVLVIPHPPPAENGDGNEQAS